MRQGSTATADPEITAPNLRAIFAVKASALGLILVTYWAVQLLISPFENPVAITLTVTAALIPAVAVVLLPGMVPLWPLRASLFVDVACLTYGLHLGGGVDNVSMPLLYPAVISLAGLLLSRQDTFVVAGLSALGYNSVVLAEHVGVLPHLVSYSRPPARQLGTVIPVNLYLFIYAWLVSTSMEKLRALYRRTEEIRREAMHAMAHDLKNPLSVIHGYANLQLTSPPPDRDQFVRGIERTAQQALDLVSNVLDADAIDGRPLSPRLHPVQLNELVGDVADRYRHTADAARVELRIETVSDLPELEVDGQLLARALGNLISNAIKYGAAGGAVTIATAAANGRIEIRVRNDGQPIPAEELPLLFRRHSRTSSSRGVEGSGLGLYIVRCIAEAHGGSASVASNARDGSTFTLSLPAKRHKAAPLLQ